MGIADFGAGSLKVSDQIRERLIAQAKAEADEAYRQQQMAQRASQFDAEHGLRLKEFDARRQADDAEEGRWLADTLPGDTFLPADSPDAKKIPSALLQPVPEIPAMGEAFQGPMPHGATPQDAQRGRKGGFLKTRTQGQQAAEAARQRQIDVDEATRLDRDADNQRMTAAQQEAARHNRAMEGAAAGRQNDPNRMWVIRNGQPMRVAEADIQPGDTPYDKALAPQDTTAARESTQTALSLVERLLDPKDASGGGALDAATGKYELRGYIPEAIGGSAQAVEDFNGIRNQLMAALTLPNLGALKGPMSDKDVIFVKQLASRLQNPNLSGPETRRALAEAQLFLKNKLAAGGGTSNGGGGNPPPGGGGGRVYYDADGNPVQR